MTQIMPHLPERAHSLRPGPAITLVRSAAPWLAAVGVALLAQFVVRPNIDPYPAKLLLDIGVAVTLAVSLNIVNGFTGQFSMGHAGFLAVGGYASGVVTYYGSMLLWQSADMRGGILSGTTPNDAATAWLTAGDGLFMAGLVLGGVVAALVGFAVGLPSLRLRGDYLAIVTLGFGEIVRVCIQQTAPLLRSPAAVEAAPLWALPGYVGGSLGFSGIPTYTSLFWVWLVAGVTIVVAFRLKYSTFGRAFLSIREDEIAAEAMGVNTTRYKVWAFMIAAFFAGVAGGLYAHTLGIGLSPESAGFLKSFDIIIMVVLGGLGSISGAAVAAAVVTLLPEWLRGLADYRMILYALALILMMIFRPQGLLGIHEIWERASWSWLTRFLRRS